MPRFAVAGARSAGSRGVAFGVVSFFLSCVGSSLATPLDASFVETPYATTASPITAMAFAPDGSKRLFLTSKLGAVLIVEDGVLAPEPFATLSPIFSEAQCGLLGLAFDPDFLDNGWIYFFVTASATEHRIVRLTANGDTGEEPTVILGGLPTIGGNHNGGDVGFGPDGKLYWSIGDNGNRTGVNQDLASLAAKIGRAEKDGSVPIDNPFFDGDGPNNDYVWARGFRNPFKFAWQPEADELWVSVAGGRYEQVFATSAGDHAGYILYEGNQPAGFTLPVINYGTNVSDVLAVAATGAVRSRNVATYTTTPPHRIRPGTEVTIAGVADASFNVTGYVSAAPSTTQITLRQTGPDASSGGGTITTQNIGGSVTGGAFLDSSSVPPAYRGNFLVGDYVSGRVARAVLNAARTAVTSVDVWAENLGRLIDIVVGPDGDVYTVNHAGAIFRERYAAPRQAIVATPLHARISEDGRALIGVRLARAPSAAVRLDLARSAGDADVTLSPATLEFGPGDWSEPQFVEIRAADDADSLDDSATLSLASAALTGESVAVHVNDDDVRYVVLSARSIRLDENTTVAIDVSLSAPPDDALIASVSRSGDDDLAIDEGAELSFDATNWDLPQSVVLSAADDADLEDDAAGIVISAPGFEDGSAEITIVDDDAPDPVPEGGAGGAPDAAAGSDGVGGTGSAARGGADAPPRAGSDAGGAGSSGSDGSGCGCRSARGRAATTWLPLSLALAFGIWRRRARRLSTTSS